jgi:beta-catenin-like protein 1
MSSPKTNGGSENGHKRSLEDSEYIPASKWKGLKPGYYFGTGKAGTGYYLDEKYNGGPQKKKARKSVQIAEDRNETKFLPSADALLAEAEQHAAGSKVVVLTVSGVKAAAVALKKAIETNALQRAKAMADAAETYMESEVALYEHIAALKSFAADPVTLYPVLQEQQVLSDIVQLLLHDNVDIAVAATAVLLEWLDSDLLEISEGDDDDQQQRQTAVVQMATALLTEGAELLVENLGRMQGTADDDDEVGRGVEDILSLLENLLEMDVTQQLAIGGMSVAAVLCKETALVSWIFQQLKTDDGPYRNRSMDLLAALAPREDVYPQVSNWSRIPAYTSPFDNTKTKQQNNETMDGIEILLQSVAAFRKRQPATEFEVEFLENGGMVLASALTYSAAAVQSFLNVQGIELVMRCLKERVYAGFVSLKWLDFAGSDPVYGRACQHLVDAGALKYIFPLFLARNLPKHHTKATDVAKQKKAKKEFQHSIESTTIRILYALIRHLREDSPNDARDRVLAKFVDADNEDDNEKVNRLVELLLTYDQRARLAEYKFFRSDVEETLRDQNNDEDKIQLAALDAKLSAGGDILHRLATIAAFCCTGSKRCHRQILAQLQAKGSGIGLIREALEEFVFVLGESEQKQQLKSYLEQI